jgi:Endonuclease I/Secretion system C-terminal sorting domain
MNKNLIVLFFSLVLSLAVSAQATLPAFWGVDGSLPTGWTYLNYSSTTPETYSTTGNPAPSLKLSGTGSYLQIWFASSPGEVSYELKGQTASTPWDGTFKIQESVNGTVWTDVRTITGSGNISTSVMVPFTDALQSGSRYVRFYYDNKISGANMAIDNISITRLPQRITIKEGNTIIDNGNTYFMGTTSPLTLKVVNNDPVNSLSISGNTVTGANASDFVVTSMPSTVASNDSSTFTVTFTPTASGSEFATITINNNDPIENPYIVNLYAISGTSASEPTAQATSLSFSNILSYDMDVNYTASASAEHYLVIRNAASAVTSTPTDGNAYEAGEWIGGQRIVYVGDSLNFNTDYFVANTNYYYAVYAFNGQGGFENYLTTSPLTGNQLTPDGDIGSYYSGINSTSASFLTDLTTLINAHTQIWYSNYSYTLVPSFESRDTTNGQKLVECVYSGHNYIYDEPFAWNGSGVGGDLSREHTFCASWMPTYTNSSFDNMPEYSDLHNLFPVHFTGANAVRSNHPLGVVTTVTSSFLNAKYGTDASGSTAYEPQDKHKGDAARAIFYQMVCYNQSDGNDWTLPSSQDQTVLKTWNTQDPPSDWEIARNDYIDDIQSNRNPFIDHPEWVALIDFSTMTLVGIEEMDNASLTIYPNPSVGNQFNMDVIMNTNDEITIEILDIRGTLVYSQEVSLNSGFNNVTVQYGNLPSGIYMLVLKGNSLNTTRKLSIQ